MRCWILAALLTVMMSGAARAMEPVKGHWRGVGQEAPAVDWQAQWIWLPDDAGSDMILARRVFRVPSKPLRATLAITASSRYQLFVNGRYVCSGPARSAAHHQSYDLLDVAGLLSAGENVIAIRVHHQAGGVTYYGSSRAGLLAQLDCELGDNSVTVPTDASWRVTPDARWSNASPPMAMFHLEVCDRVDMRKHIVGWKEVGFDDADWHPARVLRREVGWPLPQQDERPNYRTHPWTSLHLRDIPYLIERTIVARRPVFVDSVAAPEMPLDADQWIEAPVLPRIAVSPKPVSKPIEKPIHITANEQGECRVLVFDLGNSRNGRPYLDIEAPAGTVIDVMASPYLLGGCLQSPIVASTYVDRIVCSGRCERWESFYMKPTRWLAVVFRHLPGEARLHGAGLLETAYPFRLRGAFKSPDFPELERLWTASTRTIGACTTDAYTDNYRERRQYAQTAYYACLGNYPTFADTALQRRYLKQIAEEQTADGLMPAYAPRHGDDFMVILDSNCFWLRGLHQYLLFSGDEATVRELLPAARKLLELFHGFTNADGLIDSPPFPYWLDHAKNDRRGANFCLNGHYLGALEDFAQVLQWLGEPGEDVYRRRAAHLRTALREKLWDPKRRLFADALINGERSQQFSEHANAMALALRIGTPEQMRLVGSELKEDNVEYVRRPSGVYTVTPAMSYFLHAGLFEASYGDESLLLAWKRFAHMLPPESNSTLWEEWWLDGSGRSGAFKRLPFGRSDAQTESAFFPGLFMLYVLGIEPTQPGMREVVVRHWPLASVPSRSGAIPTPRGLLSISWRVEEEVTRLQLATPPGTVARIDLASLGNPAPDRILVNNRRPVLGDIKDGCLVLPPGSHSIEFR